MAFADPQLGRNLLDSGRGTEPQKVTLAEACVMGDVLGYSSGWVRALATTGGEVGEAIPVSANPVVGGYTGATAGNYVYVAEGTDNGKITETAPTTGGDANTIIGVALTATEVMFFLNSRVDSTV